jgi:hypothetical protein
VVPLSRFRGRFIQSPTGSWDGRERRMVNSQAI